MQMNRHARFFSPGWCAVYCYIYTRTRELVYVRPCVYISELFATALVTRLLLTARGNSVGLNIRCRIYRGALLRLRDIFFFTLSSLCIYFLEIRVNFINSILKSNSPMNRVFNYKFLNRKENYSFHRNFSNHTRLLGSRKILEDYASSRASLRGCIVSVTRVCLCLIETRRGIDESRCARWCRAYHTAYRWIVECFMRFALNIDTRCITIA